MKKLSLLFWHTRQDFARNTAQMLHSQLLILCLLDFQFPHGLDFHMIERRAAQLELPAESTRSLDEIQPWPIGCSCKTFPLKLLQGLGVVGLSPEKNNAQTHIRQFLDNYAESAIVANVHMP